MHSRFQVIAICVCLALGHIIFFNHLLWISFHQPYILIFWLFIFNHNSCRVPFISDGLYKLRISLLRLGNYSRIKLCKSTICPKITVNKTRSQGCTLQPKQDHQPRLRSRLPVLPRRWPLNGITGVFSKYRAKTWKRDSPNHWIQCNKIPRTKRGEPVPPNLWLYMI
jgi:hypothetical protein